MASSTGSTFYMQSMMSSEDFAGDFSAAADQPITRPEQDIFVGNLGRYTQVTLPIRPWVAAAGTGTSDGAPIFCKAEAVLLACNSRVPHAHVWGSSGAPSGLGMTLSAAFLSLPGRLLRCEAGGAAGGGAGLRELWPGDTRHRSGGAAPGARRHQALAAWELYQELQDVRQPGDPAPVLAEAPLHHLPARGEPGLNLLSATASVCPLHKLW